MADNPTGGAAPVICPARANPHIRHGATVLASDAIVTWHKHGKACQ